MATDNGAVTKDAQDAKEAYLAQLRAQIARLNALLAAVESEGEALGGNGSAATLTAGRQSADRVVRPDSFFGLTAPRATRRFLEMMGKGNPQTPQAIAEALVRGGQDTPEHAAVVLKNVYTALKRGKGEEFVKIQKEWGLVDWYGDRARQDTEKRSKNKKGRKSKRAKKGKASAPAHAESNPTNEMAAMLGWKAFLKQQLKEGRTMKQAADAFHAATGR
jgi:hypothetical protein